MEIFKKFTFDSAHFLPNVPDGHKCKETHGHTYLLTLYFKGELENKLDWVIDFAYITKVVKPIIDEIDHKFLNKIDGLENPSCENLAIWIWDKVKPEIMQLSKIKLQETPTSGVIYKGK